MTLLWQVAIIVVVRDLSSRPPQIVLYAKNNGKKRKKERKSCVHELAMRSDFFELFYLFH